MRQLIVNHANSTSADDSQSMASSSTASVCRGTDQLDTSAARQKVTRILQQLAASPTEDDYRVTYCDIFWSIVSILCRIVGILININVAYQYHRNGKYNYFGWTLSCFLGPMLVTTCIQIAIYMQDVGGSKASGRKSSGWDLLCFVIIVPFLFRYCQSVSYAIASKRAERRNNRIEQKRYYELLIHEDSDIALIRIFECFLEAAPQKILQITIILSGEDRASVPQILSILSSQLSMAWCIASYHRCIRLSQVDKVNISWWGTIMQWLCHFLVSVSRVLSIAIVASLFPKWTMVGCATHAIAMALWIFLWDKSPFCSTTMFHSFAFSLVLGLVFVFNYILPKVRRTRYRFTVFYTICFLENCVCVALFIRYANVDAIGERYFVLLCLLAIVPFLLGIVFMCVYYTHFHPNVLMRKRFSQQPTAEAEVAEVAPATGPEATNGTITQYTN